jgi:hypothetical protein
VQRGWLDPACASAEVETVAKLAALLVERALPSEAVRWALRDPVLMMREWLLLGLEEGGCRLGAEMERAVDEWAPRFPISEVWAALSGGEVRRELRFCERVLMQSHSAVARFRARLRARFPDITALSRELSRSVTGGAA